MSVRRKLFPRARDALGLYPGVFDALGVGAAWGLASLGPRIAHP